MRRTATLAVLTALAIALTTAIPAGAQAPGPAPAGGTPAPGDTAGPPDRSLMEQVVPPIPCPAASGAGAAGGAPRHPMSAYTIDYDEGGFTAVSRKAIGTMTEMTFATVRLVVSVGMWLVSWAFSFGFADRLAAPMAAVAGRYQAAFFLPLVGSALLVSGAYGALEVFRGRMGRGVGEFGLSLVLAGVFGAWLLADPKAFLDASLRFTAQLAGSMATVALADAPPGCTPASGSYAVPRLDAAVQPLGARIQQSFVEQPYELLEWVRRCPPPAPPTGTPSLRPAPVRTAPSSWRR